MKTRILPKLLTIFLLLAWSWSMSATRLQFNTIKNLYKEGEFGKIRVSLESFLKQAGESAQPNEKIFAYKYLGVVYAAESQGIPVAESYFYQMLELAPNAYLSDLYVSTAVENVFEKTKERFQKEIREKNEFDEFGNPRKAAPDQAHAIGPKDSATAIIQSNLSHQPGPLTPEKPQPEMKAKRVIWPWVVIGVGVAAGAGVFLWILSHEKGKTNFISAGP